MTESRFRWHVYGTSEEAEAAATERLAARAAEAIAARGAFVIALSGGTTPLPVYRAATHFDTRWNAWHVYFADERCLPPNDAERNDATVGAAWLDHVPIPREQIHAIPAERGPDAGAAAYGETLAGVGPFDVVLLGVGEDGHTASLFPGHPLGAAPDAPDVLAVREAPKPPPERVSLSAARLSRAEAVLALVLGEGKRAAVSALRHGTEIPMRAVAPSAGVDVYLDSAADGRRPGR